MGAEAVVTIKTTGGSEAAKVIADLARAYAEAQKNIERAAKASGDRQVRAAGATRRGVVRETVQTASEQAGVYRRGAATIERTEQLLTRAKLRELALQGAAQKRFIELYVEAEKRATALITAEVGKRGELSQREKRQVQDLALAIVASHERAEQQRTAVTRREAQRRRALVADTAANAVGGAVRGTVDVLRDAHGQIQDSRRRVAVRESELNTTLLQTGAGADEMQATQARVRRFSRDEGLDPERVLGALGVAQSFANALGGATREERGANLEATLRDVQFASIIDPQNIEGLVRVGALTRGRMGDEDRAALLRSFAGISFQGSVETDQMITQGLRGLQEAWSTGTANVTDPAQASRVRLDIARDFAAQVQAAAASGATTTVAANRTNTVPTFLGNTYRQDQIGRALWERRGSFSAEQRAAFDAAFSRDQSGRFVMDERARGRASDAARFFGVMFNNDAGAVRNFLGTHGGGGARQLMQIPDVRELLTYFAMTVNARGQQVRQYDYVDELMGSTITPEREAELRRVREGEDIRKLSREEQTRDEELAKNTGALRDLSDAIHTFQAEHPVLSTALTTGGGILGGAAVTSAMNWIRGIGRGAVTAAEGVAATGAEALSAAAPVARTGARIAGRSVLGSVGALVTMLELGGAFGGTDYNDSQRRAVEGAEWERQSNRLNAEARAAHRPAPTAEEIGRAVAAALQANPPRLDPQTLVHNQTERGAAQRTD